MSDIPSMEGEDLLADIFQDIGSKMGDRGKIFNYIVAMLHKHSKCWERKTFSEHDGARPLGRCEYHFTCMTNRGRLQMRVAPILDIKVSVKIGYITVLRKSDLTEDERRVILEIAKKYSDENDQRRREEGREKEDFSKKLPLWEVAKLLESAKEQL